MASRRTFATWSLLAVAVLLPACGRAQGQTVQPAGVAQQSETGAAVDTTVTQTAAFEGVEGSSLLLNEVRFSPQGGSSVFVELKNAGQEPVGLAGAVLENERGERLELHDGPPLAPGGVWLVPSVGPAFLDRENGTLLLYDAEGAQLDRVDWGLENPDSVPLTRGGVTPLQFPPGASIGRGPLSFSVDRLEWTTFAGDQVTPGEPNPLPGVEILLPFDGALFEAPEVPLAWYVVPGAVEYRVQVASDAAFAGLEIDAVVPAPPVSTDPLPAGTYYWRVQPATADGSVAGFSPVHTFTVEAAEGASAVVLAAYAPPAAGQVQAGERVVLPVPQIFQKKDSNMLLLESPRAEGAHAWDVAHPGYSGDDPADSANCALASIAMVNHYFGGDLTQDRIGWEVFKDRKPGPERDLNWGDGLNIFQVQHGLAVALPGSVMFYVPENVPNGELLFDLPTPEADFFDRVVELIDAGQPVLAIEPGHATVITGYRLRGGNRYFHLNDPTVGKYWVDASSSQWKYYFDPGDAGAPDDPTHYLDFDTDGINNFDEMYRFSTDPNNPDTDGDGLKDGIDVYSSVHDSSYGYSGDMNMRGRDFDGDDKPMELDSDGDDGGCMDGFEDLDRDGKHEPENDETWNFADWEDRCWKLTLDWIFSDEWGDTWIRFDGNFLVGEEQEIEGWGEVSFAHNGPCVTASDLFGFTIGGEMVEETLKLELTDIPEAQAPDVSDDLRCTIGETIGEAYAVSFGSGWALPEVIEVPAQKKATVELDTQSPLAARTGDLTLTIEKLEIDFSQ